jgi:hypothetical protein
LGAARQPEDSEEMINEVEKRSERDLADQAVVDGFSPDDAKVLESITTPVPVDPEIYSNYYNVFGMLPFTRHFSNLSDTLS